MRRTCVPRWGARVATQASQAMVITYDSSGNTPRFCVCCVLSGRAPAGLGLFSLDLPRALAQPRAFLRAPLRARGGRGPGRLGLGLGRGLRPRLLAGRRRGWPGLGGGLRKTSSSNHERRSARTCLLTARARHPHGGVCAGAVAKSRILPASVRFFGFRPLADLLAGGRYL